MATFSCLQHVLVSVLHLLFLFFVSIVMLWRKIKLNRNSAKLRTTTVNMDSGRFLLPSIKAGFLYNATFVSCINLALAYLLVVFWGMAYGWKERWFYLISLDSAAVLQVVAWSTMSCIVNNIRREGREKFSTFLRMWWAFSFLISAGSFCWNVFLLRHSVTLLLDAWVDILAFPVGTFLFIVAIYGKTGIRTFSIQDTTEHLLTGVVPGEEAVATVEEVAAYATAGFFSRATFSWMASLLSLGYKKSLVLHDIPQLLENDSVEAAYRVLKINWDMMKEGKPSSTLSILRCLLQSFWKGAALNACFAGVSSCASFVGPYFIDDFVEYLGGKHRFMHEGYVWASVFFGAKIVQGFSQSQWYFGIQQWGLRVRTALTSLIYRKGMSLSSHSFQKHTVGEVINYMSVDVDRIGQFTWYLHDTWLLPIRISLALCILYKNLGLASLVALGCTTIAVFVNLPLARIQEKFQEMVMGAKDVRMKATSEVLRNMRALKMQAWEIRYLEKLQYLRKVEYGWLQKFLYTNSGVVALFWGAPMFTAVVTFGTCVLIGVPLTTGRVLSALATFRVLQEPIYNLPDLVSMAIQTKVSLDRLSSFLQEQELQSDAVDRSARNMKNMAIEIEEASFSWDIPAEIPTLVGINLQIRSGIRVAVCGVVGSGKSSLLSCILGEIPRLSGSVRVHGSRAYVAQSAWIQSGKIEENILFGSPMDRVKYEDVLQACALQKDLEQFTHGDQTLIGERGINLSGGQKQRIQLARAIYHDADIYVLDDPFSAVDAQTAAHLFKECILRALGAKTVVYVTHQMEFLPAADLILVLRDGRIAQAGKYSELLEADTDFRIQLGAHNNFLETFDLVRKTENYMQDNNHFGMSCENQELEKQDSEIQQNEDALQKVKIVEGMAEEITEKKTPTQIVEEEERETGTVSLLVYQSYITAIYRGALAIVVLLGQIMFQLLQIASAYWIVWASPLTFNENPSISSAHLILVYMMLALGGSLCVLIRAVLVSTIALLTAQKFFMDMLQCIFHAPMSFFDATPSGRILSRASTDQSTLDFEIPDKLAGLVSTFTQLLGIVVIMSQVAWQVLALFIPVTITCVWLQRYYLTTSRELARLEGIQKSPVIHHFGESISGGPTIRGFDRVACFMETNFQLINSYARPFFYNFAAFEWLGLRLDLLTNFVFAFSLLLIVSLPKGTIDPSNTGLAVTYGLNLNILQSFVIWNLCEAENKIISLERIQQFTRIPSEAPLIMEKLRPPPDWPNKGTINLENLQVRYSTSMPLILHGISCTFFGGKKVGVVGRTGSGKSTLIQAILRIIEPTAGQIVIDGLNTANIGLHDLRSRLSIIPQDPTLFEGSVRSNVDPLDQHTDSEIWQALEMSQLGDIVHTKDQKLESSVTENGENWSVGQRQLLCLGRTLLKHTRILLMDEATASLDMTTDAVIQKTIRTVFADCTVITIAHRVPTVIDSDSVLVLSDGRIAEYDSPGRLLAESSSLFSQLVSEYSSR